MQSLLLQKAQQTATGLRAKAKIEVVDPRDQEGDRRPQCDDPEPNEAGGSRSTERRAEAVTRCTFIAKFLVGPLDYGGPICFRELLASDPIEAGRTP